MKKTSLIYVFAALFFLLYFSKLLLSLIAMYSEYFIITNELNFYTMTFLSVIGTLSGLLLLISKKYKTDEIAFYGILIPTIIIVVLNILGKVLKIEIGNNVIINIIIFGIFGLNKNFRKYFKLEKNKY